MAMGHAKDSFSGWRILKIKEDYQKITSVLAGHQIAFWEYDIPTGECNFTDEYLSILGLKEAGIVFREINDFYRFAHRMMLLLIKQLLTACLSRIQRLLK